MVETNASPIRVRRSVRSASSSGSPRISTLPDVGASMAPATWSRVVFPAPFGPMTTQLSLLRTVQSTSLSSMDFS